MGPEFLTLLMTIPCNFISVLYKTAVAHRDLNNLCALLTSPQFFFLSRIVQSSFQTAHTLLYYG